MLIKLSRTLLLIIIVVVAAHYLPKLYWMKFEKNIKTPFITYSPIIKDFILTAHSATDVSFDLKWKDTKGNFYDREDNDSLLPFMNYRQLAALNKMPDSIDGIRISLESVRLNNFNFILHSYTINSKTIPLYQLYESKSGRLKLEAPQDFFRIDDKMEFIESEPNKINEEKTKLFTQALVSNNFKFPAKIIAGNPTTKKPFDEGYFVLDSGNKLFHIKMVKGQPFCVNTNVPADLNIAHISALEMNLKEFYAYIITEKNEIFLLSYDNYKLIQLPVKNYDRNKNTVLIFGDLFYRTISITGGNKVEVFVTDRKYKLLDYYKETYLGNDESTYGNVAAYIFPFTINFEDDNTSWMDFYIKFSDIRVFPVTLLSLLITLFMIKRRKQSLSESYIDFVVVLLSGIFGLIAIAVIKNTD